MLKINSVSVCYNTTRAVQNATLTVNDGEIVGVIGLNGAGKTTLMNAIAGIIKTSGGKILLDDKEITKTPAHQRVKMGITLVPEGRHLFSDMTVLENLKTASNNKEEIYSLYNIFPDIALMLQKKAGKLSGGQQQMVAIARAVLTRPKILLLDEVTMGLSPLMTERVFDAIYNIGRNLSGIVLTGQETKRIIALSDRVYLMKTGHILECEKENLKTEKIF